MNKSDKKEATHQQDPLKENKQDLEMNRNNNARANENVKNNSFEEDKSANEVGSEITDGEAG